MTAANGSLTDWYTSGPLSSYLASHRMASGNINLIEAVQPEADCSDPGTSDLSISYMTDACAYSADLGAGRFVGDGRRANEIFVIPPHVANIIHAHGPHRVRAVAISAASIQSTLEDARPNAAPFDFGWLHRSSFINQPIVDVCNRLWDEADRGDPVSRLFADGATVMLLSMLLRLAEQPVPVHRGGLAPWQLRRATEMIAASMGTDLPLATLAAEVGLSPFHFARAFKTSTGMPPHAWQRAQRIAQAKALLETSDLPVTQIAFEVGYESSQALARLFQRSVGVSPSQWRRDHRQ